MRPSAISIELINHACAIVEYGEMRLLFDPWLTGTCFHGNWGLQYQNRAALDQAAEATHLWVSHVHSDHFHRGSLRMLGQRAPTIVVLANKSNNYDMEPIFADRGFQHVRPLFERQSMTLAPDISVQRFPASAIDNMLHIQAGPWSVLNYNDCNLPLDSVKSLIRKMGRIDILLLNYNHAGKLFSDLSDEVIRDRLTQRFKAVIEAIRPEWVVPFASTHYYRAPGSLNQNSSMLTPAEPSTIDSRALCVPVGSKVIFSRERSPIIENPARLAGKAQRTTKPYVKHVPMERLLSVANEYRNKIRHWFFGCLMNAFPCPVLRVLVSDLDRVIIIDLKKGVFDERPGEKPCHVSIHSSSLHHWMTSDFGTETLSIGGDFQIVSGDTVPLRQMLFLGQLVECNVTPRHMLGMKFGAFKWFWNRREEFYALLKQEGISLKAGEAREGKIAPRVALPQQRLRIKQTI